MTRFVDIFFLSLRLQSLEKENKLLVKLLCHMYKMSDYIYYDRSAIICSTEGIEQNLNENFTNTHQIQRWINLIETVHYQSPSE